MKYFIDAEFYERGPLYPIELISIGIVAEDGRELYMENGMVDPQSLSTWLKENVVPHLKRSTDTLRTYEQMKRDILTFIPPRQGDQSWVTFDEPEFWGYFSDYDWVVFCQIFGTMMELPKGYPMYCLDLKQFARHLGVPRKAFPVQEGVEHNALEDARWNKRLYDFLVSKR